MRRPPRPAVLALPLFLGLAIPGARSDARAQPTPIVAAERAFARLNADSGQRIAWLHWFAPDGMMTEAGWVQAHAHMRGAAGQDAAPPAAFDWRPTFGDLARSGDLGYNTGPVRGAAAGQSASYFFSVWRRQPDGEWRVAVDMGVPTGPLTPDPFDQPFARAAQPSAATGAGVLARVLAADRRTGMNAEAFLVLLDPTVRGLRSRTPMLAGVEQFRAALIARPGLLDYESAGSGISLAGDMAYTYGRFRIGAPSNETGFYVRVWRAGVDGEWRVVFDAMRPDAPPR